MLAFTEIMTSGFLKWSIFSSKQIIKRCFLYYTGIHVAWEMYMRQHYVYVVDLHLLQKSGLSKNKYFFYLGLIQSV